MRQLKEIRTVRGTLAEEKALADKRAETSYMMASAVMGAVNVFGMMAQTIAKLAERETIGEMHIHHHYHVSPGQEPYHLGMEESTTCLNHRRKNK